MLESALALTAMLNAESEGSMCSARSARSTTFAWLARAMRSTVSGWYNGQAVGRAGRERDQVPAARGLEALRCDAAVSHPRALGTPCFSAPAPRAWQRHGSLQQHKRRQRVQLGGWKAEISHPAQPTQLLRKYKRGWRDVQERACA